MTQKYGQEQFGQEPNQEPTRAYDFGKSDGSATDETPTDEIEIPSETRAMPTQRSYAEQHGASHSVPSSSAMPPSSAPSSRNEPDTVAFAPQQVAAPSPVHDEPTRQLPAQPGQGQPRADRPAYRPQPGTYQNDGHRYDSYQPDRNADHPYTQPAGGYGAVLARVSADPSAGARVASVIITFIATVVILLLLWDYRNINTLNSFVSEAVSNLGLSISSIYLAYFGTIAVLVIICGLTLGLSGLGAAIWGGLMLLIGAGLFLMPLLWSPVNLQLAYISGPVLLPIGALLFAAGIGAHFARRGGARKMRRAVR